MENNFRPSGYQITPRSAASPGQNPPQGIQYTGGARVCPHGNTIPSGGSGGIPPDGMIAIIAVYDQPVQPRAKYVIPGIVYINSSTLIIIYEAPYKARFL